MDKKEVPFSFTIPERCTKSATGDDISNVFYGRPVKYSLRDVNYRGRVAVAIAKVFLEVQWERKVARLRM